MKKLFALFLLLLAVCSVAQANKSKFITIDGPILWLQMVRSFLFAVLIWEIGLILRAICSASRRLILQATSTLC